MVGGVTAVSQTVFAWLIPLATTSIRLDTGIDCCQTSRMINFADTLSASAAAGSIASPVILVNVQAGAIDSDTAGLLSAWGVTTVKIAGGTPVVSPAIGSALDTVYRPLAVQRPAGTDRYGTSVVIGTGPHSPDFRANLPKSRSTTT